MNAWAAIRKTDGEEWIDCQNISTREFLVRFRLKEETERMPSFNALNPAIRIVRVQITEIEEKT